MVKEVPLWAWCKELSYEKIECSSGWNENFRIGSFIVKDKSNNFWKLGLETKVQRAFWDMLRPFLRELWIDCQVKTQQHWKN